MKLVHTVAATAIAAVIGPAQAQVCIWPTQARIVVWSRANPATAHTAKPAQDPRPDIAHLPPRSSASHCRLVGARSVGIAIPMSTCKGSTSRRASPKKEALGVDAWLWLGASFWPNVRTKPAQMSAAQLQHPCHRRMPHRLPVLP